MITDDSHLNDICHECIDDQFLASEVKAECIPSLCSYCDETRQAATLEYLADRTHDALQGHFQLTPNYPSDPYEYVVAKESIWVRRGDPVEHMIAEIAGLSEEAANDVKDLLSDRHGYRAAKDGDENPYGDEAMYEARRPNDSGFHYTWAEFRREIRSRSRFFSTKSEEMLRFIFGDLSAHTATDDRPVVREITPGNPDAFVWRARAALSDDELKVILESPSRELSTAPSRFAKAGRMNAQGIPVFYGAVNPYTCVSEVRAPVGAYVVVGRFDLLRSVKLLDLDALSNVYAKGSYFDPNYSEQEGRAEFFRHLASEISRPVMPQDEALEYLPTQAVAEYLAHKVSPRIDGIIFHSSQTDGDGRNVVLFNHARGVESHGLPERASVDVQLPPRGLDETDDWYGGVMVWETVPSDPPNVESTTPWVEGRPGPVRTHAWDGLDEFEDREDPTLRLDINSLEVLVMQGVTYATKTIPLSRHRQTEEERDAFSQHFVDIDMDGVLDC